MYSNQRFCGAIMCLLVAALLCGSAGAGPSGQEPVTAAGKPAEAALHDFLDEPLFHRQTLFDGDQRVREPYLAVAVDGSILATRNYARLLRRSEDGGESWGEIVEIPFGFLDSNLIVDENTGDILSVRMWDGTDRLWRSRDHGKTWTEEEFTLKPNEVMKWIEQTGLKERGARNEPDESGKYYLHANASEAGITLRHGKHRRRLLVTATLRPHAKEHPSDRKPVDAIYSKYGGILAPIGFVQSELSPSSSARISKGPIRLARSKLSWS